ncbi:Protein ELFN1 [Camelus dromedarius]|uniref:Protein ELFN1 n=1 Tax=Camelus dromedarius TaxID=9838 RepID=A0A5N4CXV3_CAMDR|nr:Protein ELFN1 [Camelus dromedarius]
MGLAPMAGCQGAALWVCVVAAALLHAGGLARGDCWLIEGDKGFVWLAICSQNQPPYEAVPQQINSSVVDLRLNENRIRSLPHGVLSRFGNLTYLNLTKNEIGYIEDGAFSGQFNLQVLQLGYNRLRNLTAGALRGLSKLEYLYLQANLIEVVTPSALWECPNIVNLDLSMNRIQRLHGATFAGLAKLSVCELYSNPFYCSCELLGFLRWLAAFANATQAYDRMQCESPPLYSGYFLLGQGRHGQRSVLSKLQSVCTDGSYAAETRYKSSTVSKLTKAQEDIHLSNLYALTNTHYCVVRWTSHQIINNCIDALKSAAAAFQGGKPGAAGAAEPQLVLLSSRWAGTHGFLSPWLARSPRPFRAEATGPHKAAAAAAEAKYIEKSSPAADAILTVTPAAAVLRAEAEKSRQYGEHRHSYPVHTTPSPTPPAPPPHESRAAYHHLSYSSSPEYTCRASQSIWERFRLSRRRHKDDEEFMAAGHALRKKVQFAKDEDLHDILDYWKGVSAQHKS